MYSHSYQERSYQLITGCIRAGGGTPKFLVGFVQIRRRVAPEASDGIQLFNSRLSAGGGGGLATGREGAPVADVEREAEDVIALRPAEQIAARSVVVLRLRVLEAHHLNLQRGARIRSPHAHQRLHPTRMR